jgi:SNF2 family DNA or RNA helicase
VLSLEEGLLTLKDSDGKKYPPTLGDVDVGFRVNRGRQGLWRLVMDYVWEIKRLKYLPFQIVNKIDSIMLKDNYLSGKSFINTATSAPYQPISHLAPFIAPTSTLPASNITLLKRQIPNEPRHDPSAPDAIVLPHIEMPLGVKPIDVVIDPLLARYLRPHQKQGVKFLYECIMGGKPFNGRGAILADEMGLGKTLTVIALIWTLLSTPPPLAPFLHTR